MFLFYCVLKVVSYNRNELAFAFLNGQNFYNIINREKCMKYLLFFNWVKKIAKIQAEKMILNNVKCINASDLITWWTIAQGVKQN